MRGVAIGVFLASLLTAANALAAPARGIWYGGFGLGSTEHSRSDYTESNAWHLLGGYLLRDDLALETDYTSLGEYKRGQVLIDGLTFNALGIAALSKRVSLQGRLGLLLWSHGNRSTGKSTTSGIAPLYGLCLAAQAAPKIQVRIGWQKMLNVADGDITLVTGDLIYFFK